MIFISLIKTSIYKIYCTFIYFVFYFLALVPIIGVEAKGAKRWLDLYFFKLQPIEILKPFFILTIVKILTFEKFKESQIKYFFKLFIIVSSVINIID